MLYKHVFKGNTVGFFTLELVGDGIYQSDLGGIYKKYRKGGLGTVVKAPEVVKGLGGNELISY